MEDPWAAVGEGGLRQILMKQEKKKRRTNANFCSGEQRKGMAGGKAE